MGFFIAVAVVFVVAAAVVIAAAGVAAAWGCRGGLWREGERES